MKLFTFLPNCFVLLFPILGLGSRYQFSTFPSNSWDKFSKLPNCYHRKWTNQRRLWGHFHNKHEINKQKTGPTPAVNNYSFPNKKWKTNPPVTSFYYRAELKPTLFPVPASPFSWTYFTRNKGRSEILGPKSGLNWTIFCPAAAHWVRLDKDRYLQY